MGRYIDADKLWDNRPQIPKGYNEKSVQGFERCLYAFGEQIKKQIDNPTADVVEVVRCKDCRYCEEYHYEEKGEKPYIKLKCKWSNYSHQPNDFCNYGERKE